jgi:hypothetical protein
MDDSHDRNERAAAARVARERETIEALSIIDRLRAIVALDVADVVTVTPDEARSLVDSVSTERWLAERVRALHAELDITRRLLARVTATRPTDAEHESTDATPLPYRGK